MGKDDESLKVSAAKVSVHRTVINKLYLHFWV